MLRLLPVLSLLLSALVSGGAEPAPGDLQVFLLIGQSNMAGRGVVEPRDQATNPRIFMLDKAGQWVPAKDPLHFDKPAIAGVGLGSEFARVLAERDPAAKIGLVPCAFGGTSLDQWAPGGKLYTDAVARTRIALQNGKLAGILWHQGEADSAPEKVATYGERFATMIAALRQELQAPEVPVIIGELGHFLAAAAPFNAALPAVAARVPRCALVTAEALAHKGDKVHFDSPGLRTFGQRYAAAYLALRGK
jgi:hypothetical protein